ncbi:hypothetical protein PSN45_004406 [Yamadazyma tenuis]|uniref:DUF3020 domain-containing protein n=1 Tax=Candida tenuis (strain ATCC 10573 / BCRC 21748 / CBS 615 / JCM 9827 / NBRC 10315 / NRRL Y-1498 / VKM Y-70) TaxID=590646 RepID=G3B5W4_CANTC|nr:uncharacterized protein CANTEDRAFT_94082 [Yamadazyma tenuis ATCC 10573]EGV63320.1 hypothetical protein CANTEDRAFT_94082 [Yamadazyma tenuis ATCC 10573]WEJ96861.1 hypothetical protein PSN45_004406 [Yamadazyma tenuis]
MTDKYESDDLDLENAIGDVFKSFELSQIDPQAIPGSENPVVDQNSADHNPDEEFNDKDIHYHPSTQNHLVQIGSHPHDTEQHDDHDLDIIDDAITSAFSSLHDSQIRQHHEQQHSETPQQTQDTALSDEAHNNEPPKSHSQQASEQHEDIRNHNHDNDHNENSIEDDDFNLANVITSAIQSINTIQPNEQSDDQKDEHKSLPVENSHESQQPSEEQNEDHSAYSPLQVEKNYEEDAADDLDLQNAIGNAFESIKESDFNLNKVISESFQNLTGREKLLNKSQIAKLRENEHIPEDVLQQLAKEITNQVSEMDDSNQIKNKHLDLPKIDDQVLNHFVNEANKEKREGSDAVVPAEIPTQGDGDDDSQLQSTIADAVKNVIGEGQQNKEVELDNSQMNDILTNAFNMAMENPTELLSNLETDEFKAREDLHYDNHELNKRLSLIDSSSTRKPVDLNHQLGSMMASLSKNNDSNLLNVIKSLTTFLTNSNFQIFKNSQSLISIINQYKHNDFEKLFINSLNLSKNYLRSNSKLKCIVAIDNILILFGKSISGDILNYNYNLITLITNSIINCITNYANLKNFKDSIFKKPRLSSLEHKEKIRIENRQRKQKWREENRERNKDNDLRTRVSKRANATFGEKESIEKLNWIEEEFNRRKERRLSKQKKENTGPNSLSGDESKDFNNEQFIQDKNLIQLVNDFFNIFSNFSPKDDPETGLFTTSVTISSASIIYLLSFNPSFEFKKLDTIVTSIVNSLLSTFNSVDQQERLFYLARGSHVKLDNLKSIYNDELNYSVDPELNTIQQSEVDSYSGQSNSSGEGARDESSDEIRVESSTKRMKLEEKVENSSINLKFPAYKNDETMKKSNTQVISGSPASSSMNMRNLKKPGTFKKPSYNDKKGKSLGFPPLYSTSIKH